MSREEMIDALVEEAINYIRVGAQHGDVALLADYLAYGFVGYENMSIDELRTEYESTFAED